MNQLPFNLIDPISKLPLKQIKNNLVCSDKKYEILTHCDNHTRIINFNPKCIEEHGAYEEEQGFSDKLKRIKPTNTAFIPSYKNLSMRKFKKYVNEDAVLLDLGCSNTEISYYLPHNIYKIGVDLSFTALFERVPNVLDSNVQDIWICDATSLPVPDNSIDLILCCDIFEHLFDPEELLKEVYRVLKPGGRLFVSVPNLVSIGNRLSSLVGSGVGIELAQILKFKSPINPVAGPRYPDQKIHLRWFTAKSLQVFIESSSFKIIEKFGIGPIVSRLKIENITSSTALLTGLIAEKNK